MRYELKYRIGRISVAELVQIIRTHPAGFSKAFPDRLINNIYFDSSDYHYYHENVDGNPHRKKLRLRWYGDESFQNSRCKLETKIKIKQLGTKRIEDVVTEDCADLNTLQKRVKTNNLFSSEMIPTLQNKYWRSYYLSFDKKYRITIDSEQNFTIPNHANHYPPLERSFDLVLELKFDECDWDDSQSIMSFIPFRQTKNSKYVNGINHILK